MAYNEVAAQINIELHAAIRAEACEVHCIHMTTPTWSFLNLANIAGRAEEQARAGKDPTFFIDKYGPEDVINQ